MEVEHALPQLWVKMPFSCEFCEKKFSSRSNLTRHIGKEHEEDDEPEDELSNVTDEAEEKDDVTVDDDGDEDEEEEDSEEEEQSWLVWKDLLSQGIKRAKKHFPEVESAKDLLAEPEFTELMEGIKAGKRHYELVNETLDNDDFFSAVEKTKIRKIEKSEDSDVDEEEILQRAYDKNKYKLKQYLQEDFVQQYMDEFLQNAENFDWFSFSFFFMHFSIPKWK